MGYVSKEEYRRNIDSIIDFLSGRYRQIERELEEEMHEAALNQEFEQAAGYRNKLKAVRSLLERQRVANEAVGTLDAIAVAAEGTDANAQVFQVRDGVLADRQSFYLENAARRDEAEVAEEFVLQYYATALAIPPQVLVPPGIEEPELLAEALAERRGGPVEIRHAERGDKRRIFELASATRGWRSTRTGCARSTAAPSGSRRSTASSARSAWSRSRCGSSASTSRT